jgi:hypothetical protein
VTDKELRLRYVEMTRQYQEAQRKADEAHQAMLTAYAAWMENDETGKESG